MLMWAVPSGGDVLSSDSPSERNERVASFSFGVVSSPFAGYPGGEAPTSGTFSLFTAACLVSVVCVCIPIAIHVFVYPVDRCERDLFLLNLGMRIRPVIGVDFAGANSVRRCRDFFPLLPLCPNLVYAIHGPCRTSGQYQCQRGFSVPLCRDCVPVRSFVEVSKDLAYQCTHGF